MGLWNGELVSPHERVVPAGTGDHEEVGVDLGKGYSVNVPLLEGLDDQGYQRVFQPVLQEVGCRGGQSWPGGGEVPAVLRGAPVRGRLPGGGQARHLDPLQQVPALTYLLLSWPFPTCNSTW